MMLSRRLVVVFALILSTILNNNSVVVVNGEEAETNPGTTTSKNKNKNSNRFDKHWTEYNRNDFWYALDCPQVFARENSGLVPTDATFHYLRDTYRALVGDDQSTIHIFEELTTKAAVTDAANDDTEGGDNNMKNQRSYVGYGGRGGFQVHVEARKTNDHGRGIFTLQSIPKGTLIYTTKYTARFPNANTYRQFLISISPDLACEVMPWSYIQSLPTKTTTTTTDNDEALSLSDNEQQQMVISIDMDYGALINGGVEEYSDDDDDDDYANIGCSKNSDNNCVDDGNYFALRGIQIGEELFVNYNSFNTIEAWKDVNLQCDVCDMTA